jgi:hypothetical protein
MGMDASWSDKPRHGPTRRAVRRWLRTRRSATRESRGASQSRLQRNIPARSSPQRSLIYRHMKFAYRIIVLTAPRCLAPRRCSPNRQIRISDTGHVNRNKRHDQGARYGRRQVTSYYFQFDGDQGDLFINIVTRNFTGDIDVFTLKDLRPSQRSSFMRTSPSMRPVASSIFENRKDDPPCAGTNTRRRSGSLRIKFAGSFVASTMTEPAVNPDCRV